MKEIVNPKFFLTMFDPVRFKLVEYMYDGEERSINEIAKDFPQDRSVISRHLEQLYAQKIVTKEKRSKYTFYALDCEYVTQQFEKASRILRDLMDSHTLE